MMHGMGWGGFGMGFPFIGLITLLILGVGTYYVIRRLGADHNGSSFGHRTGGSIVQRIPGAPREAEVYRLAKQHNGVLTVSEVVARLGLDLQEAERLLDNLVAGQRVLMDVDQRGLVTYTFRELRS